MLALDGIGSIVWNQNYHDFLFDLERVFRAIGGFLLMLLGIYFVRLRK